VIPLLLLKDKDCVSKVTNHASTFRVDTFLTSGAASAIVMELSLATIKGRNYQLLSI
jgi:hypothetical protein